MNTFLNRLNYNHLLVPLAKEEGAMHTSSQKFANTFACIIYFSFATFYTAEICRRRQTYKQDTWKCK